MLSAAVSKPTVSKEISFGGDVVVSPYGDCAIRRTEQGRGYSTTKTVNCSSGTYTAFKQGKITFSATSAYNKAVIKLTYAKASGTIWFDLVSLVK